MTTVRRDRAVDQEGEFHVREKSGRPVDGVAAAQSRPASRPRDPREAKRSQESLGDQKVWQHCEDHASEQRRSQGVEQALTWGRHPGCNHGEAMKRPHLATTMCEPVTREGQRWGQAQATVVQAGPGTTLPGGPREGRPRREPLQHVSGGRKRPVASSPGRRAWVASHEACPVCTHRRQGVAATRAMSRCSGHKAPTRAE